MEIIIDPGIEIEDPRQVSIDNIIGLRFGCKFDEDSSEGRRKAAVSSMKAGLQFKSSMRAVIQAGEGRQLVQ